MWRALVLAPILGIVAMVLPAQHGAFAAGLVAAVLAIVIASMVDCSTVIPVGAQATRTRAVLERLIPRSTQSAPDARGHARPRAPGVLLLAV